MVSLGLGTQGAPVREGRTNERQTKTTAARRARKTTRITRANFSRRGSESSAASSLRLNILSH